VTTETLAAPLTERSPTAVGPGKDRAWETFGWVAWASFTIVMAVLAFTRPKHVIGAYYEGVQNWWSSHEIYSNTGTGFLYLPQAAILFSPFALLPAKVGEACWRIVCVGLFALALRRLSRLASAPHAGFLFGIGTLLVQLPLAGSASTGQFNVLLAAAITFAVCDLADARWWQAALWLGVVFISKPPAIVLVVLAGAVYGPLWSLTRPRHARDSDSISEVSGFARIMGPISWRFGVVLTLIACVPFAHPNPSYVVGEYRTFFHMLGIAGSPVRGEFQDLVALFESFHLHISDLGYTVIRLLFAVATLALCLLARARTGEHGGAIYLLGLGTAYLMVANPRTEGLTYCIVAMPLVVFAAAELVNRRWGWGAVLALICILLGAARIVVGFSNPGTVFARGMWVRPAVTLIFAAYLATNIVRKLMWLPLQEPTAAPRPPT
jgi:hypothetical protein